MAGKAPLLLATVFFSIGALGLVFTSAERAEWGPFEPGPQPLRPVQVEGQALVEPPPLVELTAVPETAVADEPLLVAAPQTVDEETAVAPTPTPIPPLRLFGISADDAGVAAAAVTPPPPPPIRIGGIAADDEPANEDAAPTTAPEPTGTPDATVTLDPANAQDLDSPVAAEPTGTPAAE